MIASRFLVALSVVAPVVALQAVVGAQATLPGPGMAPGQGMAGITSGVTPTVPQPAERRLQLTFHPDATVTLSAQNVAIRDILAEWRRKCACTVVNAERLAGAASPVPLFFDRADQAAVLDTLLRQAAGYTLTPQRAGAASPSRYETIYILATSAPTAGTYTTSSAPMSAPLTTPGSPDDELAPVRAAPFIQNGPGQPQPPQPQSAPQQPPTAARPPVNNSPFVTIVPIGGGPATPPAPPTTGRGGGGGR